MSHYDEHDILSPYQHGFRSKHSCETQLIGFFHEVQDNWQGQQTDIIDLDFGRAFDKVDHLKLQRLGVNPWVILWVGSLLQGCIQHVVEDQNNISLLSGVPQGSVIGCCLFLSYINDLPNSVNGKVRLFADDTIVYLTIKVYPRCTNPSKWPSQSWNLEHDWSSEFNPDKCEVLWISCKKHPVIFSYQLHDIDLKFTTAAKYLGISQDLSWTNHINNITSEATSILRFIKRNVKTSNKRSKKLPTKLM